MLVRAAVRLGDGGLCRLPTMRTEKGDRGDLVQAFAQAAHIRRRDILALTQRARPACQLLIVGVKRSLQHSAPPPLTHAADNAPFEAHPLARIARAHSLLYFYPTSPIPPMGYLTDRSLT